MTIPDPCDRYGEIDEVVTALEETWLRFVAYRSAVADAGPAPDEGRMFALLELELSMDRWRERFLAGLARLGIPLDYVLAAA